MNIGKTTRWAPLKNHNKSLYCIARCHGIFVKGIHPYSLNWFHFCYANSTDITKFPLQTKSNVDGKPILITFCFLSIHYGLHSIKSAKCSYTNTFLCHCTIFIRVVDRLHVAELSAAVTFIGWLPVHFYFCLWDSNAGRKCWISISMLSGNMWVLNYCR